jgi:predicted nucleic acid-binding protein
VIFCDTSTLAKAYVRDETDAGAVRRRLDSEDSVGVSELARPELMAVFHRRLREGHWKREDFNAAVRQFDADDLAGIWSWLPLDGTIAVAAAKAFSTLPETAFLRTSDCLHLVTAVHHRFTAIHTHDKHQAKAAVFLGLEAVTIA